jgi:hypothetical protein
VKLPLISKSPKIVNVFNISTVSVDIFPAYTSPPYTFVVFTPESNDPENIEDVVKLDNSLK